MKIRALVYRTVCCCLAILLVSFCLFSCGDADDGFDGGRPIGGEELKEMYESLERARKERESIEQIPPQTVYWIDGGSVWHADPDCGYLKNHQDLLSGSPDEAYTCGIERGCSKCGKNKR